MAQSASSFPRGVLPQGASSDVALIADDDEFFRVALRYILTRSLGIGEVVETSSLDEAIERLSERSDVSLALFDLAMPGMESAASLRAVRKCFPHVQVVVVSASKRRNDILLALEAGAHGYIPKGLGVAELASALSTIRSGMIYVPASMTHLGGTEDQPTPLMTAAVKGNETSGVTAPHLTPRQAEVLVLMTEGRSNKEIARALNLGEGTVKVHVAALFRALGVTSRSAAAAAATRLRLSD